MSAEHRESDLIRSWLDESYEAERGPRDYLDHILEEVPHTPQRRRLRLPRLGRAHHVPDVTDTLEYQPSPAPATNGHAPTVIGRTQSMLSPVKAITAGALVFAIGGAFLIAQPFDERGTALDASASVEPTWVTGTAEYSEECSRVGSSSQDGVIHESFDCLNEIWTADDPRLTGNVRKSWSLDGYRTESAGYRSVLANRWFMDAESGTWDCRSVQLARGTGITAGTLEHDIITCAGDGAHKGLTAVLQVDWAVAGHPFEAIIFSGEVPAAPEASDFE